ncbi:tail fiber protein [Caudoviricetes sp.]|nr:tail fiber protein [Caudoviricetes sp.]
MTVSANTGAVSYNGNSSTTQWNIPFVVNDPSHFKVYVTNRAVSPIVPEEIPSTDYDIIENTLKYPKGTNLSPLPSTKTITIMRVVPVVQETNILEQTGYYLEDLEKALDYQVLVSQQINDTMARTVKVPIGSGINPDDYLTTIQTAVSQAQASATIAQNATQDMPAVPFKEVFGIGGTNPFTVLQSHNGYLAKATVGVGGLTVNLPKMNTLTFPYLFAVKRVSASGTLTIAPAVGDTIEGSSSLVMDTDNQTIIFVADDDSLLGTWTTVYAGAGGGSGTIGDGSITTAKLADLAVTNAKIADSAVTNAKLGNNSVTSGKIASGHVGYTHLDSSAKAVYDGVLFQDVFLFDDGGSPYTLTSTHKGKLINIDTTDGDVAITLPLISSVSAPFAMMFRRFAGSGTVTFTTSGTDDLNTDGNTTFTLSATVGNGVIFVADFTGATQGYWSTLPIGGDATILDGSINTVKIADNAITTAKILNANVTTAKLATSAVTANELASNAVTTVKITDANVTGAKIASATIAQGNMANNSVGTAQIIDANITQAKLSTALSNTIDNVTARDVISLTGATTLTATNRGNLVNLSGGTYTITLPDISTITTPYSVIFRRYSSTGTITISRGGTDTINSGASTGLTTVTLSATVGDWIEFIADFTGATANQWFTRA